MKYLTAGLFVLGTVASPALAQTLYFPTNPPPQLCSLLVCGAAQFLDRIAPNAGATIVSVTF